MVRPRVTSSAATETIRWNDVIGRPSQAPNFWRGSNLGFAGRLGGRHRGRLGAGLVGRLGVGVARGAPAPQPVQDVAAHGHYRAAARTAAANASPRSP